MMPFPVLRRLSLLVVIATSTPLFADTEQAAAALNHGRVDEAEKSLRASLTQTPADPEAHLLLCRVFYAQEQADRAVPECQASAVASPADSDSQLWLGRALGQKAQHANPLSAFSIARKARNAFERAVLLGPTNVPAMSDLGEYYVAAPPIVGGGLDKARKLAVTLRAQSPAKAHRLLAYIADKEKDTATAEAEFKSAIAAGGSPDAFVDLGQFYQQHGQLDQAVSTLREGILANRTHGPEIADAASVLIAAGRDLDLAEETLRVYLKSPAQTDDTPAFKVHLQLGKLLAAKGDQQAAHHEYAAALALAPHFAPAVEAMKGA